MGKSYDNVIREIQADPLQVVKQHQLDDLKALALAVPDQLRVYQRNRRYHYDKFDQALRELRKRELAMAAEVAGEVTLVRGKERAKYSNDQVRRAEVARRLDEDAAYRSLDHQKRFLYAQIKEFTEEIEYLERVHTTLIEILSLEVTELAYGLNNPDPSPRSHDGDAAGRRSAARGRARVSRRDSQAVERAAEEDSPGGAGVQRPRLRDTPD